ncbi:MAG: response regulator [Syntrophales bacterium LBB04]|nr:response regulator [Syntrophales bacterium LBB04]
MDDKNTILAVDDTPESLELLVRILTLKGYQVRSTDSGEQALAEVDTSPPDLILLDIRMDDMSGLEVCRRLKARDATRQIPIILISAYAEAEQWAKGLQLGAVDYIYKPFRAEEVLTRIKTHLTLSRQNVSLEQQAAELQKKNRQLQSEIFERRRVEEELRRSLEEAEQSRRTTLGALEEQKRTEAERVKLQAQLLQAQKMESVGRLAGGVAHDFNNMLGVILGNSEIAMDKVDPSLSLYADLLEIRKAAERSTALTRQLLTFARKQVNAPKVLDLNETIAGMLKMLGRLIGEDIRLTWLPGEALWPVLVDPSQIDQILANLSVNARDAFTGIGKISIETKNCTLDKEYCVNHLGFLLGEYVMISFSDNGCGMNKETQAHIFEPFFTTKGPNQGTGLGLATVYGIVKQNQGFINVYSELGQGTTFTIHLPRHVNEETPAIEEAPAKPVQQEHETILLVEDESGMLKSITALLTKQGYRILSAAGPSEALRLANAYPGEIHLLMTDVVMPEMNGSDLAKKLMSLQPNLKCLFMSGYTPEMIARYGVLEHGRHFIQKPFSQKELATKIREVLLLGREE